MARKVKITVIRRDLYQDFIDEYAADEIIACPEFEDGQEFILDKPDIPKGFCAWAWADLHREVVAMYFGANYSWIKKENTAIACCTDGLRPVTFKIEGYDD